MAWRIRGRSHSKADAMELGRENAAGTVAEGRRGEADMYFPPCYRSNPKGAGEDSCARGSKTRPHGTRCSGRAKRERLGNRRHEQGAGGYYLTSFQPKHLEEKLMGQLEVLKKAIRRALRARDVLS